MQSIGQHRQSWEYPEPRQEFLNKLNKYKDLFYDFHPYGHVFFKKNIFNEENLQLFGAREIRTFQYDYWNIEILQGKERLQWNKRFALMIEVQITRFTITWRCLYPTPFLNIQHVDFLELKELTLYCCNIDNIEKLSLLNAPKLQKINFIYNLVTQYKLLKKSNFKLRDLMIYSMKFEQLSQPTCPQLDHFSRLNFSPNLNLRLQKHHYNSIIMNDLSFMAKYKRCPRFWPNINMSPTKRIDQLNLIRLFNRQKICRL